MLSPLPSLEEVLICNEKTTVEEVTVCLVGTNSDLHNSITCIKLTSQPTILTY